MFNKDIKNFGKKGIMESSAEEKVDIPSREIKKTIDNPKKQANQISTISQGMIIKGEVTGNNDIDIYGTIEGNINLVNNAVNIESTSKLKVDIIAKTIRVDGKVKGNISADEKIIVSKTGSVIGDIHSPKVELQYGSHFDGNISMKKLENKKTTV